MISALPSCSALEGAPQTRPRYDDLTDCQIVRRAQQSDYYAAEYLLYKYRHLVRARVSVYFLMGADREDLLQIGMIGLWHAVMDYRLDLSSSSSFSTFAGLCVTRHVISAVKSATRCKQTPLNQAHSLDEPTGGSDEVKLRFSDGRPDHLLDPQELLLRREANSDLQVKLRQMLSAFEWGVLTGYKHGRTYHEIAFDLGCNSKSVDNALGRIRRKVAATQL